jgi:hypothetical protein
MPRVSFDEILNARRNVTQLKIAAATQFFSDVGRNIL